MILNLTDMSEEEIDQSCKRLKKEMEDGNRSVFLDESDYYSDKLVETFDKMNKLREEENERMIEQNEKEKLYETGECCFDTALKGSKVFQKK